MPWQIFLTQDWTTKIQSITDIYVFKNPMYLRQIKNLYGVSLINPKVNVAIIYQDIVVFGKFTFFIALHGVFCVYQQHNQLDLLLVMLLLTELFNYKL